MVVCIALEGHRSCSLDGSSVHILEGTLTNQLVHKSSTVFLPYGLDWISLCCQFISCG